MIEQFTYTCPLCKRTVQDEVRAVTCGPNGGAPSDNDRKEILEFAKLLTPTCDECAPRVQKTKWRIQA